MSFRASARDVEQGEGSTALSDLDRLSRTDRDRYLRGMSPEGLLRAFKVALEERDQDREHKEMRRRSNRPKRSLVGRPAADRSRNQRPDCRQRAAHSRAHRTAPNP
jgi:hypothetical protein